jgi:maltose O-acetyltransferase
MSTERNLMLAGKLYNSNDAELIQLRKHAQQSIYHYNQTAPEEGAERAKILAALVDCPTADAHIEVPTRMDYGGNLHIGQRFYANYGSIFLDVAPITIGDNVMFGPAVSVYTAGHPIVADVRNEDLEYGHPITIGSNVWIGGNAVICPGVTIGDNVSLVPVPWSPKIFLQMWSLPAIQRGSFVRSMPMMNVSGKQRRGPI